MSESSLKFEHSIDQSQKSMNASSDCGNSSNSPMNDITEESGEKSHGSG